LGGTIETVGVAPAQNKQKGETPYSRASIDHRAREAVDSAYDAASTAAISRNHPLKCRFRDIHIMTQQMQGRLSHFETVDAWMMGLDTHSIFV